MTVSCQQLKDYHHTIKYSEL